MRRYNNKVNIISKVFSLFILTIVLGCSKTPVTGFSSDKSVVLINEQITFNNTSTNADLYFWDFGDGTSSTDHSPVHFYSSPGTYNVDLVSYSKNKKKQSIYSAVYKVYDSIYNGTYIGTERNIINPFTDNFDTTYNQTYIVSDLSNIQEYLIHTDQNTQKRVLLKDSIINGFHSYYNVIQEHLTDIRVTFKGDSLLIYYRTYYHDAFLPYSEQELIFSGVKQ